MSFGRRGTSNLRRRRLLVYHSSRDDGGDSAASRRQFEKLREARRPTEVYGTHVNRRLRGRWFSLVPVRRRAIAAVAAVIVAIALLLCLGHWAAVAWQPLAYRPELARPLRLDRPDSFGSWARAVFFAASAGTSFLVYQLRRYRNDDFRGSYRIWPPVIALMAVASLDAVCPLVPWGGELIEVVLGRRVALAGSDWIRIVLTVGGIALAMRMLAEVRHSKLALATMFTATVGFAIPMAARWGVISGDTPIRWLVITSCPLVATAALWVACGAYLRKLFREVRKMDAEDELSLRFAQWRQRLAAWQRSTNPDTAVATPKAAAAPTRRSSKVESTRQSPRTVATGSDQPHAQQPEPTPERKKRRFQLLFWRRQPTLVSETATADAVDTASPATSITSATGSIPVPEVNPVDKPPRGRRIFGWLSKRQPKTSGNATASSGQPDKQVQQSSKSPQTHDQEQDDSGSVDDPSIDWASLGKAERRKLRREMKRGGNAA